MDYSQRQDLKIKREPNERLQRTLNRAAEPGVCTGLTMIGRIVLTVGVLTIGLLLSACGRSGLTAAEKQASRRWHSGRQNDDFIQIKDRYCGPGTRGKKVRLLLGSPLSVAKRGDGTEYWAYIKVDPAAGSTEAWGCEINIDGDVVRWHRKGML